MTGRLATRAMVFDMDGVLVNSHPTHHAAWREFLHCLGTEVSEHELAFILEGRTRTEILRHFLGDLPDDELQRYGKCKDEIFRGMEHHIAPVSGVLEFIEELNRRGMACAVATSASEIRTCSTIERIGLGGCFQAIITASDVSAGKPDPAVYRLACERMNIAPRESLAFDDARAGVQSAIFAGLRCIGVAPNGYSRQLLDAGAERVISDFSELRLDAMLKLELGAD
ncbi:MAG: HAD family phosphatase [Acidobacteria bacterium]|nr:HAD family phosphatase [Acidobacteriota bacterium]